MQKANSYILCSSALAGTTASVLLLFSGILIFLLVVFRCSRSHSLTEPWQTAPIPGSVGLPMYTLDSGTSSDNLFTVQILSLLKHTNRLLDICYDRETETREILTNESIDVGQASNQLVKLRDVLEKPFKAAKTDGARPPGIVPSVDVLNKLLSTCRNSINQVETALKQQSSQKRIKGPSSSSNPQEILTSLASSVVDLGRVMEGNQQYVDVFWKKSNADNVH